MARRSASRPAPLRTGSSAASHDSPWRWFLLVLLIIALDQLTKTLIVGWFSLGETRPVTSFFNLTRVHNAGAAFSFLAGASGWQRWFFIGLGLTASAFMAWMIRSHAGQKLFALALSLILAGAVGNVIDRIVYGHVVDFLQFRFGFLAWIFPGGYFPSFNVADSAITLGAIGLLLDELIRVRRSR